MASYLILVYRSNEETLALNFGKPGDASPSGNGSLTAA